MEKFSYSSAFYHSKIFTLKELDIFKEKVEEAYKIEKYFFYIIPNIELLRPYIVMSYRLNRDLNFNERISYIRGLVYASEYIDLSDLSYLPKEFDFLNDEDDFDENIIEKSSIWNFTAYLREENTKEKLNQYFKSSNEKPEIEIEELSEEEIQKYTKVENEYYVNKNVFQNLLNNIEDNIKMVNNEYNIKVDFISLTEKLDLFRKEFKNYEECTIREKLENNIIKKEDIFGILKGMDDWGN